MDGLAGSTAAGGLLESRGRLVYEGSFCLTNAGEFSIVMLRLCGDQLKFRAIAYGKAYIERS